MARRKLPPDWKDRFFQRLRQGASISSAAHAAGVNRATVYRYQQRSPQFQRDMDDAIEEGTDRLEDIALKRAESGSDSIIMFLLKARRPSKYAIRDTVMIDVAQESWNALERAIRALGNPSTKGAKEE